MATVVDEARPADEAVDGATDEFVQPTPRDYPREFTIKASVADTEAGAPQSAYPIVDLSAFWLPSVPNTARPA